MEPPVTRGGGTLLDAANPVAEAVAGLAAAPRLGIDTEGDGMFRYRARLCVVQLTDGEQIHLVDTLAEEARAPLAPILAAPAPLKVIHDAAFDVRLLGSAGLALGSLLDTSVMAKFLGEPALGLGSLVEKFVGVKLEKSKQQEDWGERPLPGEHFAYLENDVRYLLPLADALLARVIDRGIEDEVATECEYVLASAARDAADPGPAEPLWRRVKGSGDLDARGKAVLRELCLVRERMAEARDVPPYRVANNQALLDLARTCPRGRDDYGRIKGTPRPPPVRDALLAAVRRGVAAARVPDEELPDRAAAPSREERTRAKALQAALTAWRRTEAAARGVHEQAVLPGHCLQDLVAQVPTTEEALGAIDGFGAFRVTRYAGALLPILAGSARATDA